MIGRITVADALRNIGAGELETGRAIVLSACESDDNVGFCVSCGAEAYSVEPDARRYRCESCGERAVFGAEELLLHFVS